MRAWLARIALGAITLGALISLYIPRIRLRNGGVPPLGVHPHLLPFIALMVGYVIGGAALVVTCGYLIKRLVQEASR